MESQSFSSIEYAKDMGRAMEFRYLQTWNLGTLI
jgi:hypothetical protein